MFVCHFFPDTQYFSVWCIQALEFWLYQLNGPLPAVLQNPMNPAVRATACDAISNIGAKVFEQLPVIILSLNDFDLSRNCISEEIGPWSSINFTENFKPKRQSRQQMSLIEAVISFLKTTKRILCITLLLGLTADEDHHTRAAAIRALGAYVLYPCLRDVSLINRVFQTFKKETKMKPNDDRKKFIHNSK